MISDVTRFQVLMEEIAILKTKIQPHDTGHIHTTISTLEDRVEELKEEMETKLGYDKQFKVNQWKASRIADAYAGRD